MSKITEFNANINDILKNEVDSVKQESKHIIQLTLDLLEQETLTREAIAIIVALVKRNAYDESRV